MAKRKATKHRQAKLPATRRDGKAPRPTLPAAPARASSEFVRAARLGLASDIADATSDFTEISDLRKRLYLQELCRTPRFSVAAKRAGISLKTEYNWRNDTSDPVFREAMLVALRIGLEAQEGELWRRGFDGVERPVWHNGQMVGTERVFDTTAAIFMMKAAMPNKYGDRFTIGGKDGGPVRIDHQHTLALHALSDAELAEKAEEISRALRQGLPAAPADVIDVTPEPQPAPVPSAEDVQLEAAKAAYAALVRARAGNDGNGTNGSGSGSV